MDNKIIIDEVTRHNYPDWIKRVTGGEGGESYMIIGSDKIALYDCGMAYCGDALVRNIKAELEKLGGRSLDYIILTHSHYDHLGGLPYVRKVFPAAVIIGGEHCDHVLNRDGALKVIKELGRSAALKYGADPDIVTTEGLEVQKIVEDGDVIDLGDRKLGAIYTPGHTKCSMAFMSEPDHVMFASETLGVLLPKSNEYQPLILKSYRDTVATIARCRAMSPKYLIMPHFGIIPGEKMEEFWNMAEEMSREEFEFVKGMCDEGMSIQAMIDKYAERYFVAGRAAEQAEDAFFANAVPTIKMYARELGYAPEDIRK